MKRILCTQTLLILFSVFFSIEASSQSWRWAQSGGSNDGNLAGNIDEDVVDIATDVNGNVYVLSNINQGGAKVAGTSKTSYGEEDVMLSSFNCKGDLRWSKTIGGNNIDYGYALQVDEKGGVYAAMLLKIYNAAGSIDNDAVIPQTDKSLFLIKYDTSGVYQWYRAPQADTVGLQSGSSTGTIDLSVEKDGTIHWLCQLPPGQFGGTGGYTVNALGDFILKYNAQGNFIGAVKVDMMVGKSSITTTKMVRNSTSGNYIIGGYWQSANSIVKIGNTTLTGNMHLSTFDATGKLLWLNQSSDAGSSKPGIIGRPALDADGNIYVTGYIGPKDTFMGFSINSTTSDGPVVYGCNENGTLLWANYATVNAAVSGMCISVRNSGEVVVAGAFPGSISWAGLNKTFSYPPNSPYRAFFTRFNTQTGKIFDLDTIATIGKCYPSCMAADNRGNIYTGGLFQNQLKMNNKTLTAAGGSNDWFITKYGYDCNCKEIPEPKFSYTTTNNNKDVNFTYTGGTYTSIEWDFGDGATSTQASPTHTYANNSFYQACVKVKNSCGDNIYCSNLHLWPTGVNDIVSTDCIAIYPNPATDKFTIEGGVVNVDIIIYNSLGTPIRKYYSVTSPVSIELSDQRSGVYTLQIQTKNGNKTIKKIVKQ